MPASAAERVANARQIVDEATRRGLALGAMHVDPLVLPVAVEPEVGAWVLDALRTLRTTYGAGVHLTGGLSNVSFGLPLRRLLNDVFIDLAADAGADSGINRSRGQRPTPGLRPGLATRGPIASRADLLTGRDPFGMEFLAAYRSGELA